MMLSAAAALMSQSPASNGGRLAFDVASIKLFKPGAPLRELSGCHGNDSKYPQGMQVAPPPLARCVLHGYSVKSLIAFQANARTEQVTGGPGWADSDRFDIEAKAPDGAVPTEAQLKEMLLSLLADQFKLRIHSETKEVSGFVLTVAKGGVKFNAATGDEKPTGLLRTGRQMKGQNIPMSTFAGYLWQAAGGPVIDRTGLTGNYTFTINLTPGGPEIRTPESMSADSEGVSIFTALQEQLGLRLDSQKVPVNYIVIDAVEKPAAGGFR